MKNTQFLGVSRMERDLYTRNMVRGESVYGEKRVEFQGAEYRRWNPARSKLCALLHSGLKTYVFSKNQKVLYLGASTGTSLSHVSDIVKDGSIFAVEVSNVSFRKLSSLSCKRPNIIPILEDASKPSRYSAMIMGHVDVVWQDISQKDQVSILKKNCDLFCRKGAVVYFALKARSIDAAGSVKKINEKVRKDLYKNGFDIIEMKDISRFQKDHTVYVLRVG